MPFARYYGTLNRRHALVPFKIGYWTEQLCPQQFTVDVLMPSVILSGDGASEK